VLLYYSNGEWIIALVDALNEAILIRKKQRFMEPALAHQIVASMYNWRDVARRTERIYDTVNLCSNLSDSGKMSRYLLFGRLTGLLFCLVLSLGRIIMKVCEFFVPTDVSLDFETSIHSKSNDLITQAIDTNLGSSLLIERFRIPR